MKKFKIKGSLTTIKATCLRDAVRKLVAQDNEIAYYKRHWYTKSKAQAWCEVKTTYGYKCIIQEIKEN